MNLVLAAITVALGAAPGLAAGAEYFHSAVTLVANAGALLQAGYARAPLLVMALSLLLVLPLAGLASLVVHKARLARARRRANKEAVLLLDADPLTGQVEPAWLMQAWLSIGDNHVGALTVGRRMLRIGRHHDNDIHLSDATVHRYHALIHRNEAGFVITDLSSEDGNGVRVNGERLAQARLADGDLIDLGQVRLKFASASS